MKFNPTDWKQVKPNAEIQVPPCLLQLRLTSPGTLFVTTQGVEGLHGEGTSFRVSIPEGSSYKVNITAPGKVFQHQLVRRRFEDKSEKFTNIDRLPNESGPLQEVTRALRMMKIEERAMTQRIRQERADAEAVIERAKPAKPKAEAEPPAPPSPPAPPAAAAAADEPAE